MTEEQLKTYNFPLPPWTVQSLGDELYCKLARDLGYFNPKAERAEYRPDLDPTPFLDQIRAQHAGKKPKSEGSS